MNPTHPHRRFPFRKIGRAAALATALAAALAARSLRAQDAPGTERWTPLFNAKNLDGWTPKFSGCELGENYNDTFRVESGVLKVSYDRYSKFDGKFGHLFYKTPFSHYRLRVEYRFLGDQCPGGPSWGLRNSGVMLHGQTPESMRKDQDFPVSIEVQFLGGNGREPRSTGNLCTPGTNVVMRDKLVTEHCNNSTSKTYSGDGWVTIEAEVHGNGILRHKVEGETVIEYEKPQLDERDKDARPLIKNGEIMLRGGTISLQAESHPIEFRKVEILLLKEE
jgi:hypothetical protein